MTRFMTTEETDKNNAEKNVTIYKCCFILEEFPRSQKIPNKYEKSKNFCIPKNFHKEYKK